MIRKVLKVLKILLKNFLMILVSILILFGLIYGGFYVNSTIYDKSMAPARNPNEIFVNTEFQDSVVRHTQKGKLPNGENFSMALWDHQIYAKDGEKAGEFSRHTNALIHYPFSGRGFPSHGGKYIEVWARAWQETGDKEYLRAINTLLDYFERNTSPESGAINYATSFPEHYSLNHKMGLASPLYKSMEKVTDTLALRMKLMADQTDSIYLSFDHDPSLNGNGFVKYAHVHTLEPGEFRWVHEGGKFRTSMWSNGYGAGNHIGAAGNCFQRYKQTGIKEFKELFLATAEAYYNANPPVQNILYPNNYSGAIGMLRNAHKLTGDRRFLDRAIEYAEISIREIMDETSPLPKASNKSDHYEAITGANGFMGSLLGLWIDLNNVNTDSATEY